MGATGRICFVSALYSARPAAAGLACSAILLLGCKSTRPDEPEGQMVAPIVATPERKPTSGVELTMLGAGSYPDRPYVSAVVGGSSAGTGGNGGASGSAQTGSLGSSSGLGGNATGSGSNGSSSQSPAVSGESTRGNATSTSGATSTSASSSGASASPNAPSSSSQGAPSSACGPCQGTGKKNGSQCGACGGSGTAGSASSGQSSKSPNGSPSGPSSSSPARPTDPAAFGAGSGAGSGGPVGLQPLPGSTPNRSQIDERTEPAEDAQSGSGGGRSGGRGEAGEGAKSDSPRSSDTDHGPAAPSPENVPAAGGVLEQSPDPRRDSTKGLENPSTPGGSSQAPAPDGAPRPVGGETGHGVGAADEPGAKANAAEGATEARRNRASEAADGAPTAEGEDPEARRDGSNEIDLPDFEIHESNADITALERAGRSGAREVHAISGVWEQIEGPSEADFGPGGYERSVLMLNPATKVAAIYRVFRGSIVIVMGGELALELPEEAQLPSRGPRAGTLVLRTDPSLSSRFPNRRMALGGTQARYAEPPAAGDPWTVAWSCDGDRLVLGGKTYARTTLDVFESIRRGGGDISTPEERVETAPGKPSAARSDTVPTKEAAFFGVRDGGRRFVFIADISGSMAGSKLDRLKTELADSIRALDDDAEFAVIFFAGSAHAISRGWMQAKVDRDRAVQLIGQQGCNGGTDPTAAFNFAFQSLSPIPDCIFFMTDGQIPPWIPELVRRLNSARIPTVVHSIVVGSVAEEPAIRPLMEQIASENRGTYTFVPQ